jgi:hypothetical protein
MKEGKKKKNTVIFRLIFLLVAIALMFSIYQNTKLKNENASLNDAILANENNETEETEEIGEGENVTENSFEEDIVWFLSQIYTNADRVEMYDNISFSITDDVTEFLFGEDLPPEPSEFNSDVLTRSLENVEVFGKYIDDTTYKAIVRFDVVFDYHEETDKSFTVVEVDLKKYEDDWLINNFVEYTTGYETE